LSSFCFPPLVCLEVPIFLRSFAMIIRVQFTPPFVFFPLQRIVSQTSYPPPYLSLALLPKVFPLLSLTPSLPFLGRPFILIPSYPCAPPRGWDFNAALLFGYRFVIDFLSPRFSPQQHTPPPPPPVCLPYHSSSQILEHVNCYCFPFPKQCHQNLLSITPTVP